MVMSAHEGNRVREYDVEESGGWREGMYGATLRYRRCSAEGMDALNGMKGCHKSDKVYTP